MNRQSFGGEVALVIVVACIIMLLPVSATAEETSLHSRADALFSQALRLMTSDHCQDAIPLFIESQEQDPAAATLTNLATCYERLGKIASAYVTYKKAARTAVLENDYQLQKRIDHVLLDLGPRLTRLRILPIGSSLQPIIRINGQRIADLTSPIPLDPGENVVEATAPGRQPWRRTLSAGSEGTLILVEVPELSSALDTPRRSAIRLLKSEDAGRDSASETVDLKLLAIVGSGIAATGIAVGTALAFSAHSRQSASNVYCDGRFCTEPGIRLRTEADKRAELATWSIGIGLTAATAAAVFWATAIQRDKRRAPLSLVPELRLGRLSAVIALEGAL